MQNSRREQEVKTPEQRSKILQAYRHRKGTQRQFAREHGVARSTLQSWLRKRSGGSSSKGSRFIRLPNFLAPSPSVPAYQVRFANGLVMEIGSSFRDEELARLLPILQRV